VKCIRPALGIESNKHQPIVKENKNAGITVIPLAVNHSNYTKKYLLFLEELKKKLEK